MKNLVLNYLSGKWRFKRHISEPELHVNGTAIFEDLSQNGLSYHEYGNYIIDGVHYDFFQKRVFCYNNKTFLIYKNDNTLLHSFFLTGKEFILPISLKDTHICGSDTYQCTFIFETDHCFKTLYKVKGSNKNYKIKTCYTNN